MLKVTAKPNGQEFDLEPVYNFLSCLFMHDFNGFASISQSHIENWVQFKPWLVLRHELRGKKGRFIVYSKPCTLYSEYWLYTLSIRWISQVDLCLICLCSQWLGWKLLPWRPICRLRPFTSQSSASDFDFPTYRLIRRTHFKCILAQGSVVWLFPKLHVRGGDGERATFAFLPTETIPYSFYAVSILHLYICYSHFIPYWRCC